MKVKQKDIAEKLGISIVAVSKALNDQDGVSEELRKLVKETALQFGYQKEILNYEIERKTSNIAIIIPRRHLNPKNMTQSFYLEFFEQISTELLKNNYCAILNVLEYEDEKKLVLPKLYLENKIEGIIFLGEVKKNYIEVIKSISKPIVLVDFYSKDFQCHSIVSDNLACSYEITNYLIQNGHQKIGFLGSIKETSSIQDRYLGYYKALLENGLTVNPNWTLQDRNTDGEYIDVQLPNDLPTAFVCNSDRAAYGLCKILQDKGFIIGKDISLVGFDNDIFSKVCNPKLTTVAVNIKDMSIKSVEVLLNTLMNKNNLVLKIAIPGKIIYRNSVHIIGEEENEK